MDCNRLPSEFAALAQTSDKVDDYVQSVMKERKIPGIALLVVQDSKVVRSQGLRLLERGIAGARQA